jgi:hypothetical protein
MARGPREARKGKEEGRAPEAPLDPGAIQRDWDNREFVETVNGAVRRLADFLAAFDRSTRFRLAALNERLVVLERRMDYIERRVAAED